MRSGRALIVRAAVLRCFVIGLPLRRRLRSVMLFGELLPVLEARLHHGVRLCHQSLRLRFTGFVFFNGRLPVRHGLHGHVTVMAMLLHRMVTDHRPLQAVVT